MSTKHTCSCGHVYDMDEFNALPFVGLMNIAPGTLPEEPAELYVMRNCTAITERGGVRQPCLSTRSEQTTVLIACITVEANGRKPRDCRAIAEALMDGVSL